METSSFSPRCAAKALKCAVRCGLSARLRKRAAVWIFSQSALSGRDDRAAGPVDACLGRAGRGDADIPRTAAVAELLITTAAIAVVVSMRPVHRI
jgi:hypothetical protein